MPKGVKVFRNKVMDHTKELVHINQFRGKVPEFQKDFAYETPKAKAEDFGAIAQRRMNSRMINPQFPSNRRSR